MVSAGHVGCRPCPRRRPAVAPTCRALDVQPRKGTEATAAGGGASDLAEVVLVASNLRAARSGDRRLALETLRDSLAAKLDGADASVIAQISGQYRQTLAELDLLAPADATSKRDELRARRDARRRSG